VEIYNLKLSQQNEKQGKITHLELWADANTLLTVLEPINLEAIFLGISITVDKKKCWHDINIQNPT